MLAAACVAEAPDAPSFGTVDVPLENTVIAERLVLSGWALDGGIWSDARDTVPAWDLTDHLEEDPANCQWNDRGEVMPGDWLWRYRRAQPLSLEQIEVISGRRFGDWSRVQPPVPAPGSRYWEDPYFELWE